MTRRLWLTVRLPKLELSERARMKLIHQGKIDRQIVRGQKTTSLLKGSRQVRGDGSCNHGRHLSVVSERA